MFSSLAAPGTLPALGLVTFCTPELVKAQGAKPPRIPMLVAISSQLNRVPRPMIR